MATIQRNVKTYGNRSFVGEVSSAPSNYAPILSNEVDADLDTIYAAWNGGTDTVNLKDGSVTFAKLAADAQLWRDTGTTITPGTNFASRTVALAATNNVLQWGSGGTIRSRLVDFGSGTHRWVYNANATGTVDDVTKAPWMTSVGESDAYTLWRSPAGATATWTSVLQVGATGSLTVGSSATAGKIYLAPRCAIYTAGGSTSNTDFSCNGDSTVPSYDQSTAGWLWRLGSGPGNDWCNLYRRPPAAATFTQQMMTLDSTANFTILGAVATKASGTTWANPSDRRLKDDIEDYATGLAAILQLQPRTFLYNGKGGSTAGMRGYGFIADEIAPIMSETVGVRAGKLDPDDEDETDIQTLDQSNLILALVNAVKELAGRVATLEGAAA